MKSTETDFSIHRLRDILCVLIAVASTILCSHPSSATDKGSEPDFINQVATRLKPLQRNGWLGWKPGTELVTTYLPSDTKEFDSHVQADLTYTIGEKNAPLTRTQFFDGESHVQELFPGRPEDGPIPVAGLYKPNSGVATQLSLDGKEVECLLFTNTLREFVLGGEVTESVRKEWILASDPTICLRWQSSERTHGVVKSIGTTRNVGGTEYRCVVVEQRMGLANDSFSIETKYLSTEIPGFVVERTTTIHKRAKDAKPLRIHEQVKHLVVPK